MRISPVAMLLFSVVVAVALFAPRRASAEQAGGHTVAVAVLAFDSEDAEDQADAFTGALRSRVRAAQGWSLIETPQSLAMLTAALKCPARPPPECQQRIGEQVKAERYVWGYVSKGPQANQVTAEVHLYQRGKPDTVIKESYADNLKEQNDDTLRKITQRVLERLGGNAVGVVVVHGPADMNGEVIIDGGARVPMHGGTARIELSPGSHSVEVVPVNGSSSKRNVLVAAGEEVSVDIAAPASAEPAAADKPFPTKKVVGGVALGGGLILGAVAIQQFLFYGDLQDRGEQYAKLVPEGKSPCEPNTSEHFCNTDKRARTASAIAITSASVGAVAIGAGIYFLFIASDASSERPTSAAKTKPRLMPTFGPHGGGFALSGAF